MICKKFIDFYITVTEFFNTYILASYKFLDILKKHSIYL